MKDMWWSGAAMTLWGTPPSGWPAKYHESLNFHLSGATMEAPRAAKAKHDSQTTSWL